MPINESKRRLISCCAAACAVFGLVTIAVWARSYWVCDSFGMMSSRGMWKIEAFRGGIYLIQLDTPRATLAGAAPGKMWQAEPAAWHVPWPDEHLRQWTRELTLGMGYARGDGYSVARFPLWLTTFVLMLLPLWWLRHPFRRKRRRFGVCRQCGYDLRASDERCPECGETFEQIAAVAVDRKHAIVRGGEQRLARRSARKPPNPLG